MFVMFPQQTSNKGGVGKTSYFLVLCVSIVKTVQHTFIVTIND